MELLTAVHAVYPIGYDRLDEHTILSAFSRQLSRHGPLVFWVHSLTFTCVLSGPERHVYMRYVGVGRPFACPGRSGVQYLLLALSEAGTDSRTGRLKFSRPAGFGPRPVVHSWLEFCRPIMFPRPAAGESSSR